MRKKFMLLLSTFVIAAPLIAKDSTYVGSVHTVASQVSAPAAKGKVFHDVNRNSQLDQGEVGIAGVSVSNGWDVVLTDKEGNYELPVYSDMNLFIT